MSHLEYHIDTIFQKFHNEKQLFADEFSTYDSDKLQFEIYTLFKKILTR